MVVTSGSSEFTHTWTEVSALPLRPPVKVTPLGLSFLIYKMGPMAIAKSKDCSED